MSVSALLLVRSTMHLPAPVCHTPFFSLPVAMVKGVCTTTAEVKAGGEPGASFTQHEKYHDAFSQGKPLTGYWHGPGLPKRLSSYGTPECKHLFFASHKDRLRQLPDTSSAPPSSSRRVCLQGWLCAKEHSVHTNALGHDGSFGVRRCHLSNPVLFI